MKAVREPLEKQVFQGKLVSDSQESRISQDAVEGNFSGTWSRTGRRRVDFAIEKEFVPREEKR